MNRENDKFLCEAFPKIFAQRSGSMRDTAMCWGFECGDGWFHIIHDLCRDIQRHVDRTGIPQVEATQVKEKYGTLRFYTNHSDDIVDLLISQAETRSGEVCDVCGEHGEMNESGWMKVRCKEHQ